MHHLDSTAGESKGHGPEGALARPIRNLIEGSQSILHSTLLLLLTRQWDFSSWLAGNAKWGTLRILCRCNFCGEL